MGNSVLSCHVDMGQRNNFLALVRSKVLNHFKCVMNVRTHTLGSAMLCVWLALNSTPYSFCWAKVIEIQANWLILKFFYLNIAKEEEK